jgi:uncharacterized Ntn-hydrolase superfamily protein
MRQKEPRMPPSFWFLSAFFAPPAADAPPPRPVRPVHTYSIVARDPATGQIGVAVQSHWFSVGSVVTWAEAGVGAVATQSLADPAYGPLGLDLMRAGKSASEALHGVIASDPRSAVRQVAMVDARGGVAGHTGDKCIAEAGNETDAAMQFSVQANLMEKATVWPAMARAFREAKGDLADRMLAALEAAEHEGGDIRGRQSAAILIVKPQSSGKPWEDKLFDLRVEDHAAPLVELRRLVAVQRAYNHMNAGDLAVEKKDFAAANAEYTAAAKLAPDIVEIPFWQAVTLASNGKVDDSLPIFRQVFVKERTRWLPLIRRLAKVELLPADEAILKRIESQADAR